MPHTDRTMWKSDGTVTISHFSVARESMDNRSQVTFLITSRILYRNVVGKEFLCGKSYVF